MKQTTVNFLWHMHQPYYRDDLSCEIVLPWVFLHALKDYYDMPWYLSQVEGIKATFNLVPSLLIQLRAYEDFEVRDKLLIALRKEVSALREEQKHYLAEHLFYANVEHMIKPLPRYFALYEKRLSFASREEAAAQFSDQEFLDLEVLYLLAWCGLYLRKHNTLVAQLLEKGAGYSQQEKIALLKSLSEFIATIIPFYKKLMDEGRIEVSTTPFNHPISPLLLDIENGKRANPSTPIPDVKGDLSGDAVIQTERAIDYYTKLFGHKPTGFWPAEGAVSYDFLKLIRERGILWAASDEEILYKTLGKHDKQAIYRRNRLFFDEDAKESIALFFRDHALSDLIGFTYSGWEAEKAVEDFIGRIETIHRESRDDTIVNVILDGENAWEYYPNNAFDFFSLLYNKLVELPWCETATMGESMQNDKVPETTLTHLEPGSWIGGNFNIWIGHKEKNRAWELIYRTRADYEKRQSQLDAATQKRILKEFLIAESSDWFWWYGDDHHTAEMATFDALFRKHLINVYYLMQETPPDDLFVPIAAETEAEKNLFLKEPTSEISPFIDGRIVNFFEWLGAGEMDLEQELSSMNMEDFRIKKVLFGWDEQHAYFAMQGEIAELVGRGEIILQAPEREYRFAIGNTPVQQGDIRYQAGEIFELRLPKMPIYGEEIRFTLMVEGKIAQQIPLYSKIALEKMDHLELYWFV
ncbi:MAG TPA: glycoside hydrolase [Campylobacteraceae bacterium]|nr:glycoside hydrolase [Campylobacteraceae bacterium]